MRNEGRLLYEFAVDLSNPYTTYTQIVRLVGEGKRVLEVGCSTGALARCLSERGCEVVGIEKDAVAAGRASSACRKIIVADAEDHRALDEAGGPFDAVILADVIEHLKEPEVLLGMLKARLSPGGFVVGSVPNVGHWLARRDHLRGRWEPRDLGIFDRTHLHFYTRRSLTRMVSRCGYRMTFLSYVPNYNCFDDITFRVLTPLYRIGQARQVLNLADRLLSRIWPTMFCYQFVFKLVPCGEP